MSKDLIRTPFVNRMPNVNLRTLYFPNDLMQDQENLKIENKENGDNLTGLNFHSTSRGLFSAEKRKWSEVKRSHFSKQNCSNDSSSSDEEVKELFSKQQKNNDNTYANSEDKPQKTSPTRSSKIRPCDSHARKRHRVHSHDRIYSRPSLDFEKMQKVRENIAFKLFKPQKILFFIQWMQAFQPESKKVLIFKYTNFLMTR